MNTLTMTKHVMPVAVQPSVLAAFASVAEYQAASAADGFADFGMASIGADAAAHVSGVWGLPCISLVRSICTETNKRCNTKANTNTKLATTSMSWLLRPSGVQGDPPV